MKSKILIADDHYVIKAGATIILKSQMQDLIIDYAEHYWEVLSKITQEDYDLLLLDIEMPGSTHKNMIAELKNIKPDLKILIYTSHHYEIALQYIREGAEGYLHKQAGEKDIITAVNNMLKYGYYYPPQLVSLIAKQSKTLPPLEKLSERELQIFNLLSEGNGNLEIANILNLKMSTISTYKKRIYEKLDIHNLAELIILKNKSH
ncbi:response regulator [Elizabethkingia anophelis]|uniref:response regulator n=1 Tax=Elizabethkingia anophelis TaxID=1117645 RepID=UPI00136FA2FB|nr:response regulator transcription factor [Elizabethkingia anophelis]MYY27353.1 DNA-binding response regulator [Elizabethkingia anophelis]